MYPGGHFVVEMVKNWLHDKDIFAIGNCQIFKGINESLGRAVAQAVSVWLPITAARVRVRAACGVCGGQSGTGAGFLRVLRFPLRIIIPPISPSS
jgi:hypothetical protein